MQGFCKFLSKILTLYIRQKAHKSFSYLVFLFVQQPLNNKEYFFSSLQGLLVSSLFIDLLAPLRFQFFIPQLASALIGGAIIGVGVGLMLRYKTSTGGTDLLAEIISETFSLNIALVIILIDGVIVLAGLALLKLDAFLYSCIAIIAMGFITSLIKGK